MPNSTLTTPVLRDKEDRVLDVTLRPRRFSEFGGQEKVKRSLKIFLTAAKKRSEALEHILIYGPPGIGKTCLAHVIANEMGVDIKITSGPAIERTGDLASILTNLSDFDVLFIDEIHRLNRVIEEMLYPAMEDYALDLVLGKGPSARTLRLDLPKLTIIGATTRIGLISSPLRDRFGVTYRLDFYSERELQEIILRSAKILGIKIAKEAALELAKRSRGTPRVANRLLKRVRDFAQVKANGVINPKITERALKMLEVDKKGLDGVDRKLLLTLIEKFSGGPVGLETISAAISEDSGTIEDVLEPFLLQQGFIKRTPRGRVVTKLAYKHLGIAQPKSKKPKQETLL